MEFTVVDGLRTLRLDLVLTLALAAVVLLAGGWVLRRVGPLARASIPAAAVGGLLFALAVMLLRAGGTLGVALDISLRGPLQIAFFTTIGFGATWGLLRAGGARMILFFVLASLTAVVQNVAGLGLARALGAPDALGVICGSLTLTGGPATGLAWADRFESAGVAGAGSLIIAAATFGIFVASIVGNPVAAALIRRFRLARARADARRDAVTNARDADPLHADAETSLSDAETSLRDADKLARERRAEQFWAIGSTAAPEDDDDPRAGVGDEFGQRSHDARRGASTAPTRGEAATHDDGATRADYGTSDDGVARVGAETPLTAAVLLRNLLLLLAVMGLGALVGAGLARAGVTLPAYVGAMLVAAVMRNLDDRFKIFRLDARALEALGVLALALFLVVALMDLKLWQLAGLALPMLVILCAQVLLTVLYAVVAVFVLMGRDYEAAVTTAGHIGFGLGITPNAVANMEALVARYGPAPRSFLYVPVVGAFFIDFSNTLVITVFANFVT